MTITIWDFPESARIITDAEANGLGTCSSAKRDIGIQCTKGDGAWMYTEECDNKGNRRRMLDLHAAFGAMGLGWRDSYVENAVLEAWEETGPLVGVGFTPHEREAVRLIRETTGTERVVLGVTGDRAVQDAIRVARAFTGRDGIAKHIGSFVGGHDQVLIGVAPSHEQLEQRVLGSAGIHPDVVASTYLLEWNNIESARRVFAAHGPKIAAVVTEPVLHEAPSLLPRNDYLQKLAELCREYGILLIIDEMVTGYRHALGGLHQTWGVKADLSTYGKALGNGYTISAIAGRAEIMEMFGTFGGPVFYGGTHNGGTFGAAAAVATIQKLMSERPFQRVAELGDYTRRRLEEIIVPYGDRVLVTGAFGCFKLVFPTKRTRWESYADVTTTDKQLQADYDEQLRKRGVLQMGNRDLLSAATTRNDVDFMLERAADSLTELTPRILATA